MAKVLTRDDDERLLAMISARCRGQSVRVMAAAFGVSISAAQDSTKNVRDADFEMPDLHAPEQDKREFYW